MVGYLHVVMALSVAGMVILPVFGLLLRFQPRFVHGLHVDSSKAEFNCYIAAGVYGVVFVLSAIKLCLQNRHEARLEHERLAQEEERLFGRHVAMTKPNKKGGRGKDAGRHDNRTSSREDTAIMLDSSSEAEATPL